MPYVFASLMGVVLAWLAGIDPVFAQERVYYARSGQPIPVLVYFSCGPRGQFAGASGAAQHGSVTMRYATGNRCGNPNHPVVQLIYTSRPGFRGQDEAIFYTPAGTARRRIIVR